MAVERAGRVGRHARAQAGRVGERAVVAVGV